jgi:excisionase family DNA binding protein
MTTKAAPEPRLLVQLAEADLVQLVRIAVRAELTAQRPEALSTRARDRLTVREAAAELRCCDRQVRRLIATGRLRVEKLASGGSSRVFIRRAEIERLLADSTI